MNLLKIKCPGCKGLLWIDPSDGRIVDHVPEDHKKIDLGDFIKTQKTRGSDLEDQFNKAKEEKEKRKKQIEKDFIKAKENPDELEGDYQSPFQWD